MRNERIAQLRATPESTLLEPRGVGCLHLLSIAWIAIPRRRAHPAASRSDPHDPEDRSRRRGAVAASRLTAIRRRPTRHSRGGRLVQRDEDLLSVRMLKRGAA